MEIDREMVGLQTGTHDSFFDLSDKRIRKLSLGSYCYYNILRHEIGYLEGGSVLELFGGIGRSGIIIQDLLSPNGHKIYELNPEYVQHMKRVFTNPKVEVQQGDAFEFDYGNRSFGLVCLDHPSLTFKQCEDDPQINKMMMDAAGHADNILMTFIGLSKVAPLREVYTKRYGVPIQTQEDYLLAGSARLIPGFGARRILYTGSVFYIFFTKGWTQTPVLQKVSQDDAKGWFRVL